MQSKSGPPCNSTHQGHPNQSHSIHPGHRNLSRIDTLQSQSIQIRTAFISTHQGHPNQSRLATLLPQAIQIRATLPLYTPRPSN
ncbi:hypothetical protein DPMN_083830 [Dreissena polymorpha]|uniref:Uncharacterized protein n=1 Tax=Dreissena polymorpha TaxID=45954 RepID=A0A9D4BBH5_DREPO|nr:hypothetical protein DPMN_083830 [Dreissena polymorpha]